jgi:hypothetical protein
VSCFSSLHKDELCILTVWSRRCGEFENATTLPWLECVHAIQPIPSGLVPGYGCCICLVVANLESCPLREGEKKK